MDDPALTWQAITAMALTVTVLILFIGEWLSLEGVSVLTFATLGISGIMPGNSFLMGLSSPAPWLVASLFVVGAGFLHTGIVHSLGAVIFKWSGYSSKRFLLILMIIVMVISAFINNTTVVAVFMPLTILWARQLNIAPSRLLMPLSFCAILGGTCTLIGSSTNVVIASFADVLNFAPIGMFEMSGMGIIYAFAGLIYMFIISIYFIPDRHPAAGKSANTEQKRYITELQITDESSILGKKIKETPFNKKQDTYKIFNIVRGDEVYSPPFDEIAFKPKDLILLEVPTDHIDLMQQKHGLSLKADHHLRPRDKGAEPIHLAEAVISPGATLIGKTLAHRKFRSTYHVVVLAIQRRAKVLDQGFSSIRLESGDILMISGSAQAIERLDESKDITLISNKLEEHQVRPKKAWIALAILAAFILASSLTNMPITSLSLLSAGIMVGLGCLSMEQAYQSINWKIILFLGSAISLGSALEKTGAANFLAYNAMGILEPFGTTGAVAGIYIFTVFISSLVTNNAAAAIMIPLAYGISTRMGIDPKAIIMTVLFASSAAFATPIGYQTNIFIYEPGGYRFRDFLLVGIPLNILLAIVSIFMIPHFWLLH